MLLFIDNSEAQAAIVNGSAKNHVVNEIAAEIWNFCALYDIGLWVERVRSKSNIADLPSRKKNRANYEEYGLGDMIWRQAISPADKLFNSDSLP